MQDFPRMIDTGVWDGGHIQGIAVDPEKKFIYYSYTTVLVKARLDGTVVGWVGGLMGHLGCIDFNDSNGKVYGSLEYKHDSIGRHIMNHLGVELAEEDAFYVAIFDVDKIDRPYMDAQTDGVMKAVYLPQVVEWYGGTLRNGEAAPFRVTGIDGLGIGPVFGGEARRLMLCSGTYEDPEHPQVSDYHVVLQFDWQELDAIAAPLEQLKPHHFGLDAECWYFLDIGNTTWGVQNLEYDAYDGSWLVCVYPGKRKDSMNHPMYRIDGKAAPVEKMGRFGFSHPHLVLKSEGVYDEATGLWGLRFTRGATGAYAFGDGRYYFSHEHQSGERNNSSVIRMYHRGTNPRYLFEATGAYRALKK